MRSGFFSKLDRDTMQKVQRTLSLLLAVAGLASATAAASHVHHQMQVDLDPTTGTLTVTNTVTFPEGEAAAELLVNAALTVRASSPPASLVPTGDVGSFFSINGMSGLNDDLELARYRFESPPEDGRVTLTYSGPMDFGLSDAKEEYTRGFRETIGVLSEEGVYHSGGSFWYPHFSDDLVEFELEVTAPEGWHVISQGDGSSRDDGRARWSSAGPMDEIYLVGGPLLVYRDTAGAVETLVYLHEADDSLASKYLTTTAQYLEMYRELIGPYPYGKFALVENFWETGYGMPSFTLLGPQVLRFPFILHSSYPHEILHNWWGNSVFVDYATGNWCEGLTAYMADHLVQEQRGKGDEYRRGVLRKYRDYVKEGRDFPLREFRSRHSAATEAVGYGKTLMGFHMLRRRLGDEAFVRALQRFNRKHKGQRAAFADLRAAFEGVAEGEDLGRFFTDWVERTGAVDLKVTVDGVAESDGGFTVSGRLEQVQKGEPLAFDVPLAVETADGAELSVVTLAGKATAFEVQTLKRPLRLHVDPLFDSFRLLDPRETPSSIGQIFGEPEILALLPSAAGEDEQRRYRELMAGWQSDSHAVDVRLDTDVDALPADRGVWILGRGNRFAGLFVADPNRGVEMDDEKIVVEREEIPFADHSVVWIRRHPENLEKAVGWLVVEPAAAFPGMGRKLPHYGKYSYLGFAGEEPANTVKGQWPTSDSPMVVDLRRDGEPALGAARFEKRTALAELPPVFSQQTLRAHVEYLASPELEGRGVGSDGLRKATEYVAQQLEAAGLRPGGDDGTWFQRFQVEGPDGETEVANVIGYLPGSRAEWSTQSAILSAHHDHLGRGWPDARQGFAGQIHPGADDNASGVAVLIELAKTIAAAEKPSRNLVFAAFTTEEAGRLGSRHYVENPLFPIEDVWGIVNLDTIGRLGDKKLSVLGTGTASEWQHIFRGASFVTGVESRNIPGSAEGSDQWTFIEKGIPGVQIFTDAHSDYHRPGDVAEKIDVAGLVKIATFVKEGIVYLGEREDRMTVTIAGTETAEKPAAVPSQGGRRVSFGSVPDFAFEGPGVKLSGVTPGSPAEKAGLKEGDVLLRIDDVEMTDLRAFSGHLRTLQPGQSVRALVRRGEEKLVFEVTVVER